MRKAILICLLLISTVIYCSKDEQPDENPRDPSRSETVPPVREAAVWQQPAPDQAMDASDQLWSAPPPDQNVDPSEAFQLPSLRDRAPRDVWLEPQPE